MERQHCYILDDNHKPVPATVLQWARWLEGTYDRKRVALTKVGRKWVSTVFLGLNHNWFDDEHPILFETMIYGPKGFDDDQWRYHTWDEAVKGHNQIVRKMKRKEKRND